MRSDSRSAVTASPSWGDDTFAMRATIESDLYGSEVAQFVDVIFVRVGRAVTWLLFMDTFNPFDAAHRDQLVETVTQRLVGV